MQGGDISRISVITLQGADISRISVTRISEASEHRRRLRFGIEDEQTNPNLYVNPTALPPLLPRLTLYFLLVTRIFAG